MTDEQYEEYGVCEDRLYELRHLKEKIRCDMPEDETTSDKQSELGRVYDLLTSAEYALMGRMNELDPENYTSIEREYGFSTMFKKAILEARKAGINFVALWEKAAWNMEEAMKYIVSNGLASLNYELTCEAIEKYYADKYAA